MQRYAGSGGVFKNVTMQAFPNNLLLLLSSYLGKSRHGNAVSHTSAWAKLGSHYKK